jgi:hypothetical protein
MQPVSRHWERSLNRYREGNFCLPVCLVQVDDAPRDELCAVDGERAEKVG